jgi:hypothetical protein
MKRFSIDAPALMTSALVLTTSDMMASQLNIDVSALMQSNSSRFSLFSSDNSRPYSLNKEVEVVKLWKAEYSQRFQKLSRMEAREELTIAELAELEELTQLRRVKKFPRTADEIIWQRKQQALTNSLLESLKKYVEFHEATNPATKS